MKNLAAFAGINSYCNCKTLNNSWLIIIIAILELNPDFLQITASLDSLRTAGIVLGPLHGIPFPIKDNLASKDKIETTAGSWMLLGSVVPRDTFVVSQLRKGGTVLMGKSTPSERADMRSSNCNEGQSAGGGQARSPYNQTLNPGGSSSGSEAAAAGNLVTFDFETGKDGSGKYGQIKEMVCASVL